MIRDITLEISDMFVSYSNSPNLSNFHWMKSVQAILMLIRDWCVVFIERNIIFSIFVFTAVMILKTNKMNGFNMDILYLSKYSFSNPFFIYKLSYIT